MKKAHYPSILPRRSASLAYTPRGHFHFRQSYKHLKHNIYGKKSQ